MRTKRKILNLKEVVTLNTGNRIISINKSCTWMQCDNFASLCSKSVLYAGLSLRKCRSGLLGQSTCLVNRRSWVHNPSSTLHQGWDFVTNTVSAWTVPTSHPANMSYFFKSTLGLIGNALSLVCVFFPQFLCHHLTDAALNDYHGGSVRWLWMNMRYKPAPTTPSKNVQTQHADLTVLIWAVGARYWHEKQKLKVGWWNLSIFVPS